MDNDKAIGPVIVEVLEADTMDFCVRKDINVRVPDGSRYTIYLSEGASAISARVYNDSKRKPIAEAYMSKSFTDLDVYNNIELLNQLGVGVHHDSREIRFTGHQLVFA